MKIVVLGWGSLIWDSRNLELPEPSWQKDGPMLPIEFARKSNSGRLTLVIHPGAKLVQVLWATMHQTGLSDAVEVLRKREGTNIRNVGHYSEGRIHTQFPIIKGAIEGWVRNKNFDAVIWTDLKSNFDIYSEENVLEYLNSEADKSACREYIKKAPKQIDTEMRRKIVQSEILHR